MKAVILTGLVVVVALLGGASATVFNVRRGPHFRAGENTDENEAVEFLRQYNEGLSKMANAASLADWAYNTNITDENAAAAGEAYLRYSQFAAEAYEQAARFNAANFSDEVKKQIESVGSKPLPDEEEMKELQKILSDMGEIYGKGTSCINATQCLPLEPDLTELLASTETPEPIRKAAWIGWHDKIGAEMRPKYLRYVELKNKLAQVNSYDDYGHQMRERYGCEGCDDYELTVKNLYDTMLPLYKQLHAYVRFQLSKHYKINLDTTIPQHLLGDMWGRFWTNTYSIAAPYPSRPSVDVTDALIAQGYTIERMFQTAEDFYSSLGLIPLPDTFYNLSMLDKPSDRDVVCHATAWDFSDAKDFRIKMCTKINFEDFLTIHHEMGHIQYFMQYSNLPAVYRDGANDGFHEAVGELMSMCVSTPKHLYTLGLMEELIEDKQTTINYLFSQALTTVASLPFHYVNDLYRWDIFQQTTPVPTDRWNARFWELFREIVGVTPPEGAARGEDVLDSPTIFHVAGDYDMIRYFTRTILQFQFAETLCNESGHQGELYECDFYGSMAAGHKLAAMLKIGASKPWPDALEAMTGTRMMDAAAIRKYFEPLEAWLTQFNMENKNPVGW